MPSLIMLHGRMGSVTVDRLQYRLPTLGNDVDLTAQEALITRLQIMWRLVLNAWLRTYAGPARTSS